MVTIARFMAHALNPLNTFYCKGALGTTVNPDTIGCVLTSEFFFNTYVWTGKFLNLERKSCGFKNIRIRAEGAYISVTDSCASRIDVKSIRTLA